MGIYGWLMIVPISLGIYTIISAILFWRECQKGDPSLFPHQAEEELAEAQRLDQEHVLYEIARLDTDFEDASEELHKYDKEQLIAAMANYVQAHQSGTANPSQSVANIPAETTHH